MSKKTTKRIYDVFELREEKSMPTFDVITKDLFKLTLKALEEEIELKGITNE